VQSVLLATLKTFPSLSLVTLGFFVALRVLRFPDLTCDASYAAGMVGFAVGLVHFDSSGVGLLLSILLGALAGVMTGVLYSANPTGVFKILASVLVLFAFYSINFRLLGQEASQGFFDKNYLFKRLLEIDSFAYPWRPVTYAVSVLFLVLVVLVLYIILKSHLGARIRAAGWHPELVQESGGNYKAYLVLGLLIANSTIAMGGWLHSSLSASTDITIRGIVIDAIAALLLGELLIDLAGWLRDRRISLGVSMFTPLVGSLVYIIVKSFSTFILKDQLRIFIQSDRYVLIAFIIFVTVLAARSRSAIFADRDADVSF
jgi:putative tryptophan/tyrosine transport system permease protein